MGTPDIKDERPFEENLAAIDGWIDAIANKGQVAEIDPRILRDVLAKFGANFEISEEERLSLRRYSNLYRRPGMDAVWGIDKVNEYKRWLIDEYIPQHERKTGRELPTLYDRKTDKFDNVKHSGMLQFFGEFTAFAAGEKSFADYQRLTENRAKKGREWQERDLSKHYEPSPNAPFPPGFPKAAWDYIRTWKK